uniref:Mitochondrial import receptor subunit TOM22 homolog n=1 Tax=Strongyloides papillosus TaxID=174720 RepID=A0A0N5BXY1_STREA
MDKKIDWDSVPDEDIEETLIERIVGLSEFCPDVVNKAVGAAFNTSKTLVKGAFYYARNGIWILATTFVIGAVPFLVAKELHDLDKAEQMSRQAVLLGPQKQQLQAK